MFAPGGGAVEPASGERSLRHACDRELQQAFEEQQFDLYAPGSHHLASTVDSRDDVGAAHTAARTAVAEIVAVRENRPERQTAVT
jgi:hypothetical protein